MLDVVEDGEDEDAAEGLENSLEDFWKTPPRGLYLCCSGERERANECDRALVHAGVVPSNKHYGEECYLWLGNQSTRAGEGRMGVGKDLMANPNNPNQNPNP